MFFKTPFCYKAFSSLVIFLIFFSNFKLPVFSQPISETWNSKITEANLVAKESNAQAIFQPIGQPRSAFSVLGDEKKVQSESVVRNEKNSKPDFRTYFENNILFFSALRQPYQSTVTVSATFTNSTCENNNGTITATGFGGNPPYQYSLDGTNFQSGNIFNGLAPNHYTVTIMDSNNDTGTTTADIIDIQGATVTAALTNSTCGNPNGTITATGIGGTAPYQFSIDGVTFQSSNIFNGLAANNYTVTIKDANHCTNTTTVTIANNTGVTVTAASFSSTCGNANGSITASGANGTTPYQYSINGITFQLSNVLTGLAAGTYTVTIKDATNCTNTTIVTIGNISGPTVTATSSASTCGNANGNITATPMGGTSPFLYSINGTTFQLSNIFTNLAANNYTVTIKDANNCINTTPVTINNITGATVSAVATNTTCGNASGTITATGAGGVAPYLFSINGTGFQPGQLFSNLFANTYTVTIKDANNCINTSTVTITDIPGATVTATTNNSTCGNANGSITATGTGGAPPYQYSINNITYQASGFFNGVAAGTFTIYIKDANGCINTGSVTVTNSNGASVTAVTVNSTCGNANGSLTATGTGGVAPYQYSIDGVNYQSAGLFSNLSPGNYILSIKDANLCINTTSVTIVNTAGATATVSATKSTCGNANGSITVTGIGGTPPYQYSINGVSFQGSNVFNGLLAGTYTITIKDAKNCSNTTSATIANTTGPTLSVVHTNTFCGTPNGIISATGSNGTPPYEYSIDGINYQSANLFTGIPAGTFSVTVKDSNSCTKTVSVTLTNTPGPGLTATWINPTCGFANGSITAQPTGGTAPFVYSIDGINFQSSNIFNNLEANTYILIVKDANNCEKQLTVILLNIAGATVTLNSTNSTCGNSNGAITVLASGGTAPYMYSDNSTIFQSGNTFTGLIATTYLITVKDANNCLTITSLTLPNSGGALVGSTSIAASCGQSNGTLTATTTGGTAPFQYSIDGTHFQNSPGFTGLAAGPYTITIKDSNNCVTSGMEHVNNDNGATVTASSTHALCGNANGIITATGSGGATPYQYSLDGIIYQSGNVFTHLLPAAYTVYIKDSNNCTNSTNIIVPNVAGATVTGTATTAICGNANGSLTATGTGGVPPLTYSIDGVHFQSSGLFSNILPLTYTLSVKDSNGCITTNPVTVPNIPGASLSATIVNAACGLNNGTITASSTGGTGAVQYSLNGVSYNASNVFNLIGGGNYTLYSKDSNGCVTNLPIIVPNIAAPTLTAVAVAAACNGSNGSITATATGGNGSYLFSKTGMTYQLSNVFNGLTAGVYTIYVRDGRGCKSSVNITVPSLPGPTVTLTPINSSCSLFSGIIQATGTGGTPPYFFSIDGTNFQASGTFSSLNSNTYTITIKDVNNCSSTATTTISNTSGATVTATLTNSTCGIPNGSINATGSGGTAPYQFSIDGVHFQSGNVFNGLLANNYIVTILDANNCSNTTNVTISNNTSVVVNFSQINSSCGNANGSITAIGSGGTSPYEYSLNGSSYQTSNVFNGLLANTYTVYVKDLNNCVNMRQVILTDTAGATISGTTNSTTCGQSNGTITATGIGGTAPYQYSIDGINYQSGNIFNGLTANTYQLSIKDAIGCIQSIPVQLQNITGPGLTVTGQSSTCGQANGQITVTGTGGTIPYQYSLDGIIYQPSNIFSNLSAGNYTVTIRDANNCTNSTTIHIANIPGATVSAVETNSTCGNSNGSITATGVSGTLPYQFSIDGIHFQSANVFNGLTAGSYIITIKDSNNCTATNTVAVNNVAGATVSATSVNSTCGNANGTVTATGTGGTVPYLYSLDGINFQAGNIFNNLAANTYTVILKDGNGCINNSTITVSNTAGATVTAGSTNSTCGNSNGTITATGTGGTLPYQYSIDGINFQASNIFNGLAANTYTVTIKDGNACIGTTTVTVSNTAGATVTATSTNSTCGNSNGTITATGTGGTAPYQYSIDGINFQSGNIFTGLTSNTYTITIKDGNGCIGTTSAIVSNTAGATVTATTINSTCGNSNGTITATGTGGTTPYQYSIDGINFQTNNVFTGLAANTYTITIKDSNNCTSTSSVTLSNTVGATVTATTTNSTCGNSNGTITAIGAGGTTPYQYSIDGINFQTSNIFNGLAANTYTITIKDGNSCIGTTTATVSNTAGATVTVISTNTTCGNSIGTITATGTGGTSPYQFSIDGINFQASNLFNNLAANTYTVTIKDANNCINTAIANITNTNGANITAGSTNSTCGNSNGTITATGTGGTLPYQYSIDGINFQTSNAFNGLVANNYTVTIKDGNACIGTTTVTVSNTAGATVTATTTNSTCGNSNGTITATGTGGTAPYQYSIDGINFQSGNIFTGLIANTYTITIQDGNACIGTTTVSVSNTAGATVTAITTNSTCGNSNGTITATGTGGTAPYQYSIDGINFQTNNVFTGLAANTYTITIKDSNNCTSTSSVTLSNTAGATVTATTTNSTCGNSNGTITAIGAGGTTPYQYSIDGINFQTSNIFNGLAANTYTITIKDGNSCIGTTTATVSNIAGATVTVISTNTTCGNSIGTITATGIGGTSPYQFSIDGINFQASNLFNNLAANAYTVTIKDTNNCISTVIANITNTNGANITAGLTNSTCGNSNGTITATGTGGTLPYQYSINGINFQTSNIFNGLAANNYTVTIKDGNGCIGTTTVTVSNTAGATVTATTTNSTCGNSNGSITATGTGGTVPYQYSIDGINFQAGNIFNGLAANTYTITIKDGNGCIGTTTVSVSNTAGATVTATTTNSTCGNSNGTITATGTGGTTPYQYSIDGVNFQTSNIFNGLAANTYIITIKDGNGCIETTTVTVSITAGATVTATTTNSTCGNSNGSITATGAGGTTPYQYSIDGTNFQTSNIFNTLAANTYTVTIKDANGCISTTTVLLANTAGASVTAASSNSTCGNNNGTITITGNGGTLPYQYSLDGINFQTGNSFNGLAANTYTVTIKDANGCINSQPILVSNTAGATVSAVSSNSTCGNSNGSINATGTGGTAPYQYSIDGINFQTSNIFNGLAANTYTVTIKDGNGCIGTTTVIVYNTAGATVTAATTNSTCGNSNGTITATGTGGIAPYQYSIDGVNFQSNNIFSGLTANTYTITIKDGNGCIGTTTVSVSNTAGATVTATTINSTCGNSNGTITATGTGGTTPYQYSIDGVNFQTSNIFTGLAANTYNVTIKDANNCTSSTSAIVSNTAGARVTATTANSTCGNSNGTITATGTGGTTPYQFSIDGIHFQSSPIFNGLAANTYTVTIQDQNQCIQQTNVTVINTPGPSITTTSTPTSCSNNDGAILVTGNGGTAPYQYSLDGINFQPSNYFTGLSTGTYYVILQDANHCRNTATSIVTLNNTIQLQTVPQTSICEGYTTALLAVTNATNVSWSPATGLSSTNILHPIASPITSTTYTITATTGSCVKRDSIRVIVNPAPVPDAGPDKKICFGINETLTGSGGNYYHWSPGNYLSATNIANPTILTPPSGIYTYSLTVTDAIGCSSLKSDTVSITILPQVFVFAGNDTALQVNTPLQLNAIDIHQVGFDHYTWSPTTGLNNPFIPNPVTVLNNDITYTVTAYTADGCQAVDDIRITTYLKPEMEVPTAFTPNGDQLNDIFKPFLKGIRTLVYFNVYNRYGELVYTTTSQGEGWDGTYKGVAQNPGTFVWTAEAISYSGIVFVKKGFVVLIR